MGVQIKRKVKRKKHAFKRLYSLGTEKIAVINSMLIANEPCLEVARVIQDDFQDYQDVSRDSVAKQLARYKNTELLTAPANPNDKVVTTQEKSEILATLKERVDVIAAMEELVNIQHGRIMQTVEREKKIGVPFQWLTKDIVAHGNLLQQLLDMEFETGLRHRVPKDATMHMVPHQSGEEFARYLAEKQNHAIVNQQTLDVLNILDAEYDVVDDDNNRPGETEKDREQSI